MTFKKHTAFKVILGLVSVIVSYVLAVYIAETYFFDKLYYQKSISFGYWNSRPLELFGARSEYIRIFENFDPTHFPKILGATTDETYKIAIIGDSWTWGQGIKADERYSRLLEKKLRKNNVVIHEYALPGDNMIQQLEKYTLLSRYGNYDLYIFQFFNNDILIGQSNYYPKLEKELLSTCSKGEYIYDAEATLLYETTIKNAWSNEANLCIVDEAIRRFPDNALYVFFDNYDSYSMNYNVPFADMFHKVGKKTVDLAETKVAIAVLEDLLKTEKSFDKLYVSSIERHPSALAHRLFADALYETLIKEHLVIAQ